MNWFEEQLSWFKSFFNEPDGKGSNKRLLGTVIIIVFVISYMKIAIPSKILLDIPPGWAYLIAGIIGLGVIDKLMTTKNKG